MNDEDIRRALGELGEMKLGVRAGHVRVMREDLAHHGIDFDEAARWVKARDDMLAVLTATDAREKAHPRKSADPIQVATFTVN